MSLRLCGAGFNFLMADCVGVPSPTLPGVRWPLAGVRRAGVALSHGFGRVSSLSRGSRRLARVRPTVGVPCFGAVVCFGAPCCVVPCFTVLRRAGLCCVAVRSALPCRAVVCRAVAWLAAPCCAAPRPVVLWFVVSSGALLWCVARRCAALRCAALPRVGPCIAVPWCVVGPFHCRSGVGWARR